MIVTNETFLRFAKDGRAIEGMNGNTLKRLAQESFRLALHITPSLKDIVIKGKESASSAFAIFEFDIGRNRFVLEKDMNYVNLRIHIGGSACNSRLFISHIENLTVPEVKLD